MRSVKWGAEEHENFLFAAHLEKREFWKTIIFRDSFSAELGSSQLCSSVQELSLKYV